MRTNLDNVQGKRLLIVGLGRSGIATCQTMLDLGALVTVQDARREEEFDPSFLNYLRGRGVDCYFDSLPPDMGAFDMVILSPGASPELPFVQEAKEKGAEITGELEIAFRTSRGRFVAITGTNGKTTTTTLVGDIFMASGRKTHVVGNIGTAAISDASIATEDDWLITEASSFQLETTRWFKPTVSAILNLTPDHLNRHHTMEAYGEAKAKIFANQGEDCFLVINYDDKECFKLVENCKAKVVPFSREKELNWSDYKEYEYSAFLRKGEIIIREGDKETPVCKRDELKIIGDHNIENALAAVAICRCSGIEVDVIRKALTAFMGVEHRMEYCGMVDGVKYYNDSKGTNVDASITALKAIGKNIILIAGGDGKGQDFSELAKEFKDRVKHLVYLGQDGPKIEQAAREAGFNESIKAKDIPDCVSQAAKVAEEGDTVLLSPACASWDMYDNYEQRGDHFKECVEMLKR